MKQFLICTLVTDPDQYAAMKISFLAADFDEERCEYQLFDNSEGNTWDPYAVISSVLQHADKTPNEYRPRWVLVCHQDVVLDQGHGFGDLTCALERLEKADPKWAVAGNGGVTERLKTIRHIADPFGVSFGEPLPAHVLTLDENLLIIKTGIGLSCSEEMAGFHLYGTDLCLQALVRGYRAYVVDFKLTHASRGSVNETFYEVQRKLQATWNRRFIGAIVASPVNTFGLSRYAPVRRVLDSSRASNFAAAHPGLSVFLLAINKRFFGRDKSASVSFV